MNSPDWRDLRTVRQVADIAQPRPTTARSGIGRGVFAAIRLPGGLYRVLRCEVDRLLRQQVEEVSW